MSARDRLAAYIGYEPGERDEKFEALLDAHRAEVLRQTADKLWALANRTSERGSGVLWAADHLRRMADEAAVR